jgi:hypothetical protein
LNRRFAATGFEIGFVYYRGKELAIPLFHLEVEGKAALGFDTGLDAQAFAQAKTAQFITQPGLAVFPGGKSETWKASGVIEYRNPEYSEKSGEPAGVPAMVIWGPPFAGERLDLLIEDGSRKDEALAAVRSWTEARLAAEDQECSFRPGGAIVSPAGSILFPPERLVTRCLQAEGNEVWIHGNEAYVHPDLRGKEGAAFTAAAMLYRVLAGKPPFSGGDEETLHQNIREGVFLPVNLAAPGLEEKTAALINAALGSEKKDSGQIRRPDLHMFRECLGLSPETASGGTAAFFHPLTETEQAKIKQEAARFWKKKNTAVHTRRFVIRNTALIFGAAAALLTAVLVGRSIAGSRAALPSTGGMDSAQVIRSYYEAFGALDHQMMEAAAIGKAGKADINMVTNFFVISRVRQAYEYTLAPVVPAQEWRDAGSPPISSQVFGVSDLTVEKISGEEAGETIRYRASYTLWIPASSAEGADSPPDQPPSDPAAPVPPAGYSYADDLTLIRHKGNWRISEISRTTRYGTPEKTPPRFSRRTFPAYSSNSEYWLSTWVRVRADMM